MAKWTVHDDKPASVPGKPVPVAPEHVRKAIARLGLALDEDYPNE